MVEIKGKVSPQGDAYHILIPKALVDCGVLRSGERYIFKVEDLKPLQDGPLVLWKPEKPKVLKEKRKQPVYNIQDQLVGYMEVVR